MADLATMQAQLTALAKARYSGTLRVRFSEREVQYKSDAELAKAIASLERRIADLQGNGSGQNIVVRSERGWL
jgi:hypothetical protein